MWKSLSMSIIQDMGWYQDTLLVKDSLSYNSSHYLPLASTVYHILQILEDSFKTKVHPYKSCQNAHVCPNFSEATKYWNSTQPKMGRPKTKPVSPDLGRHLIVPLNAEPCPANFDTSNPYTVGSRKLLAWPTNIIIFQEIFLPWILLVSRQTKWYPKCNSKVMQGKVESALWEKQVMTELWFKYTYNIPREW